MADKDIPPHCFIRKIIILKESWDKWIARVTKYALMRGLTTTPLDKTTFEDVRESIDQCSRGDLLNESVSHYRLDLLK